MAYIKISSFWSGVDLMSLLIIIFFFLFLLRRPVQKTESSVVSSGIGWILARFNCLIFQVIGYVSIDGVRFRICHTFNMATMTSFYTEKCCHLMTAHVVSGQRICSSVREFLIHSIHSYLLVWYYFMYSILVYVMQPEDGVWKAGAREDGNAKTLRHGRPKWWLSLTNAAHESTQAYSCLITSVYTSVVKVFSAYKSSGTAHWKLKRFKIVWLFLHYNMFY